MPNQYTIIKPLTLTCRHQSWRRQVMILILLALTSACSTSIKIAGEKHRIATEKWKELSNYTSSELPNLGFTVIAKLGTSVKDDTTELNFSEIKLATQSNLLSLDLLVPDFANKYICKPVCSQFTEYDTLYSVEGRTLLDRYLTQHEFQLFAFYGDMFVLNDALNLLQQENSGLFYYYLNYLTLIQEDFTSLDELTDFLTNHLSLERYQEFISNPQAQQKSLLSKSFSSNASQLSLFYSINPNEKWNDDALTNDPSSKWNDDALTNDPSSKWNISSGSIDPYVNWDQTTNIPEQQTWLATTTRSEANSSWSDVKNMPLKTGELVCSYNENYFGMVEIVTSGNRVNVFLQGQVQQYIDGTLINYKPGILFEPVENIVFLPLAESKVFALNDVAPCDIH